jgi:hypothetical protein
LHRMKKSIIQNILLLTVTLVIMCVAAEYVFRKIIFNSKGTFKELKDAGKYANPLTDDYWKINNYFDTNFLPPENPHPVLGWKGYFNPDNYQHTDAQPTDKRKKVLIYGDSFVMCVDTVQCFQHILNNDAGFNKNYQLLNYGVGGYGVDQIYMLCSLTVSLYDNAYIIFSIMPADMDRSILTFRIGQKPYYTLNENKLTLNGLPIAPSTKEWLKSNPISFNSYLYQRLKYSTLNKLHNQQEEDEPYRKQILTLNSQIILEANQLLKKQNVPYVFLVFDNMYNTDGEWRLDFLKKFLPENNIPFFVSSDLVKQDKTFSTYDFNNYIIKGNGHPTSHYNQLVCNEIKTRMGIAQSQMQMPLPNNPKNYSQADIDYWVNKIKQDNNWLTAVQQKAAQKNISLDSMLKLDAQFMIDNKK